MDTSKFVVLTPVKPFTRGKSRLLGITAEQRRAFAEAFARDTLAAVLDCAVVEEVVVVTTEQSLSPGHGAPGAYAAYTALPDPVPGDLNATLRAVATQASVRWPHLRPVVLCADLPALTSAVLSDALLQVRERAPYGAAFVPDAAGTGTTLYTSPIADFRPRFGPGSRAAHASDGAVELTVDLRLRQDVDEPGDLGRVAALGTGTATAAVLDLR